jgi:hemerythrin-like domain-containing protein
MKRDINIIPLSRDHHYGLLFSWKVRQGLAKHVEPERIQRYVRHFWEHHLKEHFAEEERLLFRGRPDPLCIEAIDQHHKIQGLVQAIQGSGVWIETNYGLLADQLEQHIRFEERQVFPFLEQKLTKDELAAVGTALNHHARPADDAYDDEFWT